MSIVTARDRKSCLLTTRSNSKGEQVKRNLHQAGAAEQRAKAMACGCLLGCSLCIGAFAFLVHDFLPARRSG